jgi:hypothetical protein
MKAPKVKKNQLSLQKHRFELDKGMLIPVYCVVFFGPQTFAFLPKSLVELNSILLKITFGSYKFFGFFKRANYNSNLKSGVYLVFLL